MRSMVLEIARGVDEVPLKLADSGSDSDNTRRQRERHSFRTLPSVARSTLRGPRVGASQTRPEDSIALGDFLREHGSR